jgi:hypothetical protein
VRLARPILATAILCGLLVWPACAPRPARGFDSADPSERIRAILAASLEQDPDAIPHLITLLDSDDAAVRMLAIRALERQTGLTHGYDHAAPYWERSRAAQRWADWYSDQESRGEDRSNADQTLSGGPPHGPVPAPPAPRPAAQP